MTTTKDATEALFHLANKTPFNIAPERTEELAKCVFGESGWSLCSADGKAQFSALVRNKTIFLSFAGLASLWCLALTAYCVMLIGSSANSSSAEKGQSIDISAIWEAAKLGSYLDYARRLMRADEDWPQDLHKPDSGAQMETFHGNVNNLFFGALSWILLHEIAHVHYNHTEMIPAKLRCNQEFDADNFATDWVLDAVESCEEREFRVLVVTVALAWLFLHEQVKKQGPHHPAAILRFREAVSRLNMRADSHALENATYMLKALFDPESEMPPGLSASDAFECVCRQLEDKFKRR